MFRVRIIYKREKQDIMIQRRAQYIDETTVLGQIKLFKWWITLKRFSSMSDAVKWLGYNEDEI